MIRLRRKPTVDDRLLTSRLSVHSLGGSRDNEQLGPLAIVAMATVRTLPWPRSNGHAQGYRCHPCHPTNHQQEVEMRHLVAPFCDRFEFGRLAESTIKPNTIKGNARATVHRLSQDLRALMRHKSYQQQGLWRMFRSQACRLLACWGVPEPLIHCRRRATGLSHFGISG